MSDDFETVRAAIGPYRTRSDEQVAAARAALDRIETQLASLTEENERKDAVIEVARQIEAAWRESEPLDIAGLRRAVRALDALSPIDPPSAQEDKR